MALTNTAIRNAKPKAKPYKLTDEKAMQIVKDYLAVEADRVKVRQDNLPAISAALPGKKVARFYQIENKMDAVVRYKLAETIPVVAQ